MELYSTISYLGTFQDEVYVKVILCMLSLCPPSPNYNFAHQKYINNKKILYPRLGKVKSGTISPTELGHRRFKPPQGLGIHKIWYIQSNIIRFVKFIPISSPYGTLPLCFG